MNMKFRNFSRIGSDFTTTTVPSRFINKRTNLYILEFGQFLIGVAIFISAIIALFIEEGNNPIFYGPLLVLGILFVTSAFLLASDSLWYRTAATACFLASMVLSVLTIRKVLVLAIFAVILVVVLYALYIYPPNKKYYSWVKSIESEPII